MLIRFRWRMIYRSTKLASRRSLPFMPPRDLLPRSQQPSTGSCSESDESSSSPRVIFRWDQLLILSLRLHQGLLRGLCPLGVLFNMTYHFTLHAARSACP